MQASPPDSRAPLHRSRFEAIGAPTLQTRLLTERLCVRPPRTTDVPEIRRQLRRNADHLRPWSPAPPPGEDPTSLTTISKLVLRQRRDFKRGDAFVFFLTPRDADGPILGRIALGGILRGVFMNAYLGYWVDQDHQSKGLMTEAVTAVTGFAFEHGGLHRVQAAVMPRNPRSMRVLEKVGYRREGYAERYLCIAGQWEDHVLFAITREEWQ